jgi:predicted carbohydrate-binding protein with CBM5 and CBM33 domain
MHFTILAALLACVSGHGYLSYPPARQYRCFRDGNFWWPPNGDNIPDSACRRAYRSVYDKYLSEGESIATNAAQYMFQQYPEYAANAGADYEQLTHIQENVIPTHLCAAHAVNRAQPMGDKSGMDEPFDGWRVETLHYHETFDDGYPLVVHFCPTAEHDPSYFEVYVTQEGFDVTKQPLTWSDLQMLTHMEANLIANDGTDPMCTAPRLYAVPVLVPNRRDRFVLYVRWQRRDLVGEGFYNCADVVLDNTIDHTDEL